jgi:membrane protein required for colicin V production
VLDFLLGAIVVAFAVRGWLRGLLREAIGLTVLVAGLLLSFRLSTPLGDVVESLFGASPEMGRLVAGIAIFLGISIGAAVVSKVLHKGLRVMPGLPTLNRAGGAGFATIATLAVATLALTLATVVSMPDWVDDQVEASTFADYLTDPDEAPQKAMGVVSGDRVLERLLSLREVIGARRVVGDGEVVLLEPTPRDEVEFDEGDATALLVKVNRERDAERADPLVISDPLNALARAHAEEVYATGLFAEASADGRTLADRLEAAQIPVVASDQVMALAVTAEAAQEALFSDDEQRAVITDPVYRRIGIAVVKGPLGVIIVEVLTG